jgi:DNA-binding MarR family transcriptional regulator
MTPADPRRPATQTCTASLVRLVQTLRSIQVSKGEHPWLLLDLTMAQLKALMLLVQRGGLQSRELADGLGIAPSATTPLVDRLVRQRLARRERDTGDRRIVWIRPTAKAKSLHDQLLQTSERVLEEVVDEVPRAERPKVRESVRLLLESAERVLVRNVPASRLKTRT